MNLVGKKNLNSPTQKIFTNAKLKKRQKEQYTHSSLPMYLCTKYYTKGTVYSSVKAEAVTSGQGVDNNSIEVRYCIYWENMAFIPSSVSKLPLSMEPSRGKMMKSDNPAPDSLVPRHL